jgi:zinc transport system substrate-binding protein
MINNMFPATILIGIMLVSPLAAFGTANNSATNNTANSVAINAADLAEVKVVASFYPIYDFVRQIGGDRVQVSSLVPLGVEPHDFEPTIQQIQNAETADMLVYNGASLEGPWIKRINAKFLVDTSQGLKLLQSSETDIQTAVDPHIWLDPILAKYQVKKIRDGLIKVDSKNANYYSENADKFIAELDSLDAYIKSALSNCKKKDFIAFHNAFSYFANRYGLNQHSIQGLSPAGEILPQTLRQVIQLAHQLNIDTIYSEDLIDPRLANTIAAEIPNGKVIILSPIEGVNEENEKAGIGYIDKMKQNVENLQIGFGCK